MRVRQRVIPAVVCFFALAFLITWAAGLPVVLSTHANLVTTYGGHPVAHPIALPFSIVIGLLLISGMGPALAAVVLTAWESGRAGVRDLLRQFRRWNVGLRWFAIALSIPILLRVMALGTTALLGGTTPEHWFSLPSAFSLSAIAFGPWGEELGWRGYAQPKLQERLGALGASIFVGTMWHFWHYWTSATPAGPPAMDIVRHLPSAVGPGLILNVAQSVLMAWLYNRTEGGFPIAWVFHSGIALGNQMVAGTWPASYYVQVSLYCVAALIVVLVNGPRRLVRAKSGEEATGKSGP